MASKTKNTRVASMPEPAASAVDPLEYATEVPEPLPTAATSEQDPEREDQIRQAAYAAHERRGGTDGDAVQDWLDAEAEWERSKMR